MLCDLTTTEYAQEVVWTQGDNGQVFDDYKEIYIKMLLQPTENSETRFKLALTTKKNAWFGGYFTEYPQPMRYPASREISELIFARFHKSLFGINYEYQKSQNNTNIKEFICDNLSGIQISNYPGSPDKLQEVSFPQHFECIKIGSYVANMPPNCRFMIYGIK